jgi:hypothetical protein
MTASPRRTVPLFRNTVIHTTQVNGGFYCRAGIRMAVDNCRRCLSPSARRWMNSCEPAGARSVLITGATGGIGGALAMVYAEAGSTLVLQGRNAARLAELAAALRGARREGADAGARPA